MDDRFLYELLTSRLLNIFLRVIWSLDCIRVQKAGLCPSLMGYRGRMISSTIQERTRRWMNFRFPRSHSFSSRGSCGKDDRVLSRRDGQVKLHPELTLEVQTRGRNEWMNGVNWFPVHHRVSFLEVSARERRGPLSTAGGSCCGVALLVDCCHHLSSFSSHRSPPCCFPPPSLLPRTILTSVLLLQRRSHTSCRIASSAIHTSQVGSLALLVRSNLTSLPFASLTVDVRL